VNEKMVDFEKGDSRFLLCTRGIAINKERVLLFNVVGWDWWGLPGGRVEIREHSDEALKREMREEIAADVKVGRLVWVIENFFNMGNQPCHEIGMFYMMNLPEDSVVFRSEEHTCKDGPVTLRFRWFSLLDIEPLIVHPTFLKQGLLHLPRLTEHLIWKE
jgi:ADP-ribose pyrophosphatase YjhB (NUDIX family)